MGPETEMASGMISFVFPCHEPPCGLMRVLTPLDLRGEELSFLYEDVELSATDKEYLASGMIMEITIKESRAINVKPIPEAEYQGSVVRGPQARASGHGFIVSLDPTLVHVKISADSYNQLKLEKPPLPGDFCRVRITWEEMLLAEKENRVVLADIVSLMRRPPRVSVKHNLDGDLDLVDDISALEMGSESITDLRSFDSTNETLSEEASFSPGSSDHAWKSDIRRRHRRNSIDEWSLMRDNGQRSNACPPMNVQYGEYDRFIQATLQPSMTPQLREAFRAQSFGGATFPDYPVGICRPSRAAVAAFYHSHIFPRFSYQMQYQYTYNPIPLCRTHGYIL